MELLLCFWCLENLPVPHIETIITSKFLVNSPLLVFVRFSLLLAFQQSWFHLIRSLLAKVIWFLGCLVRPLVRRGRAPGRTIRRRTGPVRRSRRTAILNRLSAGRRIRPAGRRTVRPRGWRRRTYRRTGRWAASNGHIFPT
jgi:hypothetical protein